MCPVKEPSNPNESPHSLLDDIEIYSKQTKSVKEGENWVKRILYNKLSLASTEVNIYKIMRCEYIFYFLSCKNVN